MKANRSTAARTRVAGGHPGQRRAGAHQPRHGRFCRGAEHPSGAGSSAGHAGGGSVVGQGLAAKGRGLERPVRLHGRHAGSPGLLGASGWEPPFLEHLIALSVVLFGAMLVLGRAPSCGPGLGVIAVSGTLHGWGRCEAPESGLPDTPWVSWSPPPCCITAYWPVRAAPGLGRSQRTGQPRAWAMFGAAGWPARAGLNCIQPCRPNHQRVGRAVGR